MNNSKKSLKDDFKNNPLGFSLAFAGLLLVGVVVLWFNVDFATLWPSQKTIYEEKQKLKKAQKELQKELNSLHEKQQDLDSLINNSSNFWITQRDGDVKVIFQKQISNAAADKGFALSSVNAVREDKITDGLYLMSTTIRGEGSFKKLIEFLGKLKDMKPKLYWQDFNIRPKSTKSFENVILNGTIQVVNIEDETLTDLMIEKE